MHVLAINYKWWIKRNSETIDIDNILYQSCYTLKQYIYIAYINNQWESHARKTFSNHVYKHLNIPWLFALLIEHSSLSLVVIYMSKTTYHLTRLIVYNCDLESLWYVCLVDAGWLARGCSHSHCLECEAELRRNNLTTLLVDKLSVILFICITTCIESCV